MRLWRCPLPTRVDCYRSDSDALAINARHDSKGEVESGFETPRGNEIDLPREVCDVRQVDGFNCHGAKCLLCQLPLQILLNPTGHDQDFSSGPRRLSEAGKALLLVIGHTVQVNISDFGGCGFIARQSG